MFAVKETTTNVIASLPCVTEKDAQNLCDSFNYHAANATWNTLDYVVVAC